ncbi:MAG: class I SAM-dependent methyltransferase, partial [Ruminococcus sp.]|nr:class I SAM-dependent methyltransferase [Ruminococcus sp.]
DSINHLTDKKDVQKTFERVSLFMNPQGLFVFDVNTVYKHREVLKDNVFVFDTDEVYCVWQNTPLQGDVTDISLDFFIPEENNYYRVTENFRERAYTVEELTEMLREAGFEVEAVYGDMTEMPPAETEQRLTIVARKSN